MRRPRPYDYPLPPQSYGTLSDFIVEDAPKRRTDERPSVLITDGVCAPDRTGGWGVIIRSDGVDRELSGGALNTTLHRVKLFAAVVAVEAMQKLSRVDLYTDCSYVEDGINFWMDTWKENNWKKEFGGSLANIDLWRRLDVAREGHRVKALRLGEHAGSPVNRLAIAALHGSGYRL